VTKGINNGDIKPYEFGGTDGTSAITNTVIGHLGG
jgi:hypothetical protein